MVKTLIFIHGWASSPEIWQRQKEYFSKDYEVILPEISKAKNITEAANIVNDLIKDKKGIVLIGWSLGWLVVLELLKNLALEPKGIIAVTATAKFSDDGYLGKGPTDTHLAKMIRDCKCNPQKTLEDFYKEAAIFTGREIDTLLPPGINKEIGHFNIFDIADTERRIVFIDNFTVYPQISDDVI